MQNAYDCYTGTADLYVYFYERGVKLLGQGGVLSFISSNKFFRVSYGEKLRTFLREKTELQTVIDFGDLPIFEATAYPCIVVASNREPKAGHEARTLNVKTMAELSRFTELASSATAPRAQTSLGGDSWKLETPLTLRLLEKLRSVGKPLHEYVGARFYRGITTGLNEVFVVDRATRDKLIAQHKSSKEVLKPFLRGRDVKRWSAQSQDQWLLFVPWHFPLLGDSSIQGVSTAAEKEFRKSHPAIYEYLLAFKNELSSRNKEETGIRYEWYALQRWGADYWQQFEHPKIISTKVSIRPTFALDTNNCYLGNTSYFIPAQSQASYLLALLNSSLFHTYAKKVFVEKQNGWYEVQPDGLESFPIPTASAAERSAIEGLVEKCLAARGENCGAWEAEINARVARLYHLTPDEIKLVEEATKK